MTKKLGAFLFIAVCLMTAPYLSATETAQAPSVPAVEAAGAPEANAPPAAACLDEYLADPQKVEAAGCSASYFCVHGGTVECTSPLAGTCTSSGQHCGRVTCNGQTTWCAGACYFDHHCASFCGGFGGYCDQFDCCVCP